MGMYQSKSQIQQACCMYPPKFSITHRNPLFSRSSRRMRRRPRGVSHRLAIHTPPSSDTLIKQLCRSKPATIVVCASPEAHGLICVSQWPAVTSSGLCLIFHERRQRKGLTVTIDCIAAHKIHVSAAAISFTGDVCYNSCTR